MPTNRKVVTDRSLKKLPLGAMVANGPRIGEEWVFKKTMLGKWMLYDIEQDSLNPHSELVSRHPEWGAETGFTSLNLPVRLLSKNGNREEALEELAHWRKNKLEGMR